MSKVKKSYDSYVKEPLDEPLYLAQSHCKYLITNLKEYLMGRILTIVEASAVDTEQRKAMKDLVKEVIWSNEHYSDEIGDIWIQFVEKYAPELPKEKTKEYLGKWTVKTAERSWFGEDK